MSLFTGVSVITGALNCTTTAVDANTDNGYHLLVVKNYSRIVRAMPVGEEISTSSFMLGGLNWKIFYYPNGANSSCAHFISFHIQPDGEFDKMDETVEVKFQLSFVDQVEHQRPMHIRATKTYNLSGPFVGCDRFMKREDFEQSTHLKDDCFTIRCDIMVCKHFNTHNADASQSEIHEHFDYLFENKIGADVTFEVSGEMFSAHRCVLAARSKVFMAQLFGPMKEGTTSNVIQIKDMDGKVFAALLRFIYTDSFIEIQKEDVILLQDLFEVADRYDVQRLKFLCENELSEHIDVTSVLSTLALAEQHNCHRLKEVCFKFIQVQSPKCLDNLMATDGWQHMITTYPSVLKELVSKLASNKKKNKKRKHYKM